MLTYVHTVPPSIFLSHFLQVHQPCPPLQPLPSPSWTSMITHPFLMHLSTPMDCLRMTTRHEFFLQYVEKSLTHTHHTHSPHRHLCCLTICMHVHMYCTVYTYVRTYVHLCMHTHAHRHTHTHTHYHYIFVGAVHTLYTFTFLTYLSQTFPPPPFLIPLFLRCQPVMPTSTRTTMVVSSSLSKVTP